eukprot:351010-Chlamydomonas_euryale.AAC.3
MGHGLEHGKQALTQLDPEISLRLATERLHTHVVKVWCTPLSTMATCHSRPLHARVLTAHSTCVPDSVCRCCRQA